MSAHVLLKLLNKLRKEIKCKACRAFYFFFCNEFNKFKNTRVRMLVSTIMMALELLINRSFGVKRSRFRHVYETSKWTLLRNVIKSENHW